MARYRVTAEFWIDSTPKTARRKAERFVAKAVPLHAEGRGDQEARVVRVTKTTNRKAPRRKSNPCGPHVKVELCPLPDGRQLKMRDLWRVVCRTLGHTGRMPYVWGNRRRRQGACAYPGTLEWHRGTIELPVHCCIRTALHELVHCIERRDEAGKFHGLDFRDAARAVKAEFCAVYGISDDEVLSCQTQEDLDRVVEWRTKAADAGLALPSDFVTAKKRGWNIDRAIAALQAVGRE